ncbi:MAG TPA: universal stress protein [Kofleriaceae bacterium]
MAFKKILCPTDFSAGSKHAMRVAIRLANASDAEIVLAHAWHLPVLAVTSEFPLPADTIQQMIADEQRGLEGVVREARELGAKRVSGVFLTGLPWHEIVDTVKNDKAFELIVIGTHGRTGLKRVLLGSVAENVVRHAPCPVLATRPPGGLEKFARILVPIDFSESSQRATDLAGRLAKLDGGSITLLHVIEVPIAISGELPEDASLEQIDRQASEYVETCAAKLRTEGVAVETRIRIGHPGAQTLAVLDGAPGYDLVVMGSHGRTGIRRVLLGSVAEKIVRHAACPVLVERTR